MAISVYTAVAQRSVVMLAFYLGFAGRARVPVPWRSRCLKPSIFGSKRRASCAQWRGARSSRATSMPARSRATRSPSLPRSSLRSALMVSSRFSGYNDGDLAQHFHALNFLLGVTCVYISTIVSLPSHRDAHPKPNVTPTPSPTPMPALANPFPNITSNSFLFTHDDKIRHQSSTGMLDQGGVD
mmetsp:Transcript_1310/g.2758  ORF Transcript_1310/g.2758 Transcript_1310/m.2758 type:complete len:184 (+) Transcript_1310:387-938(+)